MKQHLKKLVVQSATTPWFWLYRLLLPAVSLAAIYRLASEHREKVERTKELQWRLFPDRMVKNGPFRGMHYPPASVGSEFLPKLLGSYESELHPILDRIVREDYSAVVDIGSAEGYYAVGLGLRLPNARILAFDTNPQAQELCRRMAQLNGLQERIEVAGFCDQEVLISLSSARKVLVISDCEGFEKNLFTPKVVGALALHDVLIEVHDALKTDIGESLRANFSSTHELTCIESIDDAKKVRLCRFPELEALSPEEKLFVLREARGETMAWFFFTPRRPLTAAL